MTSLFEIGFFISFLNCRLALTYIYYARALDWTFKIRKPLSDWIINIRNFGKLFILVQTSNLLCAEPNVTKLVSV